MTIQLAREAGALTAEPLERVATRDGADCEVAARSDAVRSEDAAASASPAPSRAPKLAPSASMAAALARVRALL